MILLVGTISLAQRVVTSLGRSEMFLHYGFLEFRFRQTIFHIARTFQSQHVVVVCMSLCLSAGGKKNVRSLMI
jgi:hypothetical protein